VLWRAAEARIGAQDVDLPTERGHAVAEASVDRPLRGPEARERLAPLVGVVELRAHELCEDSLSTVRRKNADDGHARGRDDPPGDGELKLEGARPADDGAVLGCDVHTLGLEDAREAFRVRRRRLLAEVVHDRREPAEQVLTRCPPHLHGYTFSSGAYSSISRRSTPSSAKRTVTIPSAAMAVTTPSPSVEWRTESPVESEGTSRRTVTVGAP